MSLASVASPPSLVPAAQYLRTSYDKRHLHSIEYQNVVIQAYAESHGLVVVRTYQDVGRTGLDVKGRRGLRSLLNDVVARGNTEYKLILVHDVSRWGRFQDIDESAYYEFLCKRMGVPIHYCAEGFAGSNGAQSLVEKSLKRVMAAEYSRDLSTRVFRAQKRLAGLGFRVGGAAGYGLCRRVVSGEGEPRGVLRTGQHKAIQTDRIVLAPGRRNEVAMVHEIYSILLRERKTPAQIARLLNKRGVSHRGKRWSRFLVRNILTNTKYAGLASWNRCTKRLCTPMVANPTEEWVVTPSLFPPIVSPNRFRQAQEVLKSMTKKWTDEELVRMLKPLLAKHGKLTEELIWRTPEMPSITTYRRHFGSFRNLYNRAGYRPAAETFAAGDRWGRTKLLYSKLVNEIKRAFGRRVTVLRRDQDPRPALLLDSGLLVGVRLCRRIQERTGAQRWRLYSSSTQRKQLVDLLCLLSDDEDSFEGFCLVSTRGRRSTRSRLKADSPLLSGGVRFTALSQLLDAATRFIEKNRIMHR